MLQKKPTPGTGVNHSCMSDCDVGEEVLKLVKTFSVSCDFMNMVLGRSECDERNGDFFQKFDKFENKTQPGL